MSEHSPFSKVKKIQIGVIVRDMQKAIDYYESLGIGPFKPVKVNRKSRSVRGKSVEPDGVNVRPMIADMGAVEFELLEPGEERGYFWRDFLDKKGEGIHHLGFLVDDIDRGTAELERKGLEVIYNSRFENGGGAVYFDTGKVGGVLMELIQWPNK